jgi:hypothetical protein
MENGAALLGNFITTFRDHHTVSKGSKAIIVLRNVISQETPQIKIK